MNVSDVRRESLARGYDVDFAQGKHFAKPRL
jgi:hypothetical protein